jgi:hypothetical protein
MCVLGGGGGAHNMPGRVLKMGRMCIRLDPLHTKCGRLRKWMCAASEGASMLLGRLLRHASFLRMTLLR